MDGNAPEGLAYYQSVQVDYDGKFSSTEVISLTRGTTLSGIVSISPVPAVMDINVVFNASSSTNINVAIFDAAGKMVSNGNNSVIAGVNTLNLNISNLAAGTYFVKINDGNTVAVSKFVKQ
ncbi:MAG: T9SS type A sorting domain-containing protein [Sphingobacteriales bacterium]|nr:T9SS type A sorting domain-containing protein [Sphingobacteriales bacterium]